MRAIYLTPVGARPRSSAGGARMFSNGIVAAYQSRPQVLARPPVPNAPERTAGYLGLTDASKGMPLWSVGASMVLAGATGWMIAKYVARRSRGKAR